MSRRYDYSPSRERDGGCFDKPLALCYDRTPDRSRRKRDNCCTEVIAALALGVGLGCNKKKGRRHTDC